MNLKEIKNTNAFDITHLKIDEIQKLNKKENGFENISTSYGMYGMNGALLQGRKTGKLYKITARNTNLFYLN